ncbi:MAG: TIGR00725 family protein [Chloroflexi bacterium]|nr:TIGR00725 family protein [Chloroflexota bacterium]
MDRTFIAVIGGSAVPPSVATLAREVGRELARRGAVVVCGGLGGVMEAACQGAKEAGGITVGILPGEPWEEEGKPNRYVDIPIVTGIGYARNAIVVKTAQAVIAVDGSFGTLSEIAYALQSGIPVIGLDTWAFSHNGHRDTSVIQAGSPVEAVELALARAQGRPAPSPVAGK